MKKKIGKIAKYFLNVLTGIVIISIFFALYGFFQITVLNKSYANYFGYSFFEVDTGSMAPTIEVRDVVIVKNTDKIKENDIITYRLNKNFITHRVVDVQKNKVITKGDYNNFEDKTIPRKSVIGKVVKILPKFGLWKKILLSPVVIVLLLLTLFMFSLGFSYDDKSNSKKKKKKKNQNKNKNNLPSSNSEENEDNYNKYSRVIKHDMKKIRKRLKRWYYTLKNKFTIFKEVFCKKTKKLYKRVRKIYRRIRYKVLTRINSKEKQDDSKEEQDNSNESVSDEEKKD